MKKPNLSKNLSKLLKHQQHIIEAKNFKPGEVNISKTSFCQSRIVNFFGDVNTEVFVMKLSQNNKYVGIGCANGQVKVYDIFQGKLLNLGNCSRLSGYPCTGFSWKHQNQNQYIACNSDGTIKWYNLEKDSCYAHYEQKVGYLCCDYQNKDEWCAFGTENDQIQIFDNIKMKPTQIYKAGGPGQLYSNHTNRIFCIKCIKENPNLLISAGWEGIAHVWDKRQQNTSIRKIYGPVVTSDSMDYQNSKLLVGNYQNNNHVQEYDFLSGQLIRNINIDESQNSSSYCFSASYAKKSEYNLLGCSLSGCNMVKIIKDDQIVSTMQFQAVPFNIQFYQYNQKDYILVAGAEGIIYAIKLKLISP